RGLILIAPGVGEGEPVEVMPERLERAPGFARDAGAPVHHRAEHVEEQRLHLDRHGHDPAGSMPLALSTAAADAPDSASSKALAASAALALAPSPAAYTV